MNDAHTLAGPYALDAVDATERALFEEHLRACPSCVDEVASFVETAARLPVLVASGPSPAARLRTLEAVAATPRLPSLIRPEGPGQHRRIPRPEARWRPALVAAAAALLLGTLGAGLAAWQPWRSDAPPAAAPPSVTDPVAQVLADEDADRVVVDVGQARATLVRSRAAGRAVLITEAMPPAPDGSEYALWFATPTGDMVAAGTMPRRTDQTVLLDGDARDATAVGITVEPSSAPAPGSVRKPSADPVVLFDLDG